MKYKNIIIAAVIVMALVTALYAVAFYQKSEQPLSSVPGAEDNQPESVVSLDTIKPGSTQGVDPCNGTDGTGQILSVGSNTITIKRRDGTNEIIKITDKTKMRNSDGAISKSDLKKGDKVTVVVMSQHTATVVLVCNASGSK